MIGGMNNSIFKRVFFGATQRDEYFLGRGLANFQRALLWLKRREIKFLTCVLASIQCASRWLWECEQYFLGRGRDNAQRAVHAAIQLQSPHKYAKFETDDLCCLGLYELPLSEIVLAVKKERWSRAGTVLGKVLANKARSKFGVNNDYAAQEWVVVPIPTPFLRRVMRGIDHSDIIASALAKELRVPLRRVLWQRFGSTQKTLNRAGRLRRLQRFAVRRWHGASIAGKNILLVDDIRTTGATLDQAGQVLRQGGAIRVAAAVICMVEK